MDDQFVTVKRQEMKKRPVSQRIRDFRDIYIPMAEEEIRYQSGRCMDCGVAFCHTFGCPLENVIPEVNALIYQDRWQEAYELLESTNNFPEITGRLCPAPCESACTLFDTREHVTTHLNELHLTERAFDEQWVQPRPPEVDTGKRVAVIGSGPAGLAAAQQLRRAGHAVVVFEKSEQIGGLLRFGIPDFKLEKHILDRRIRQLMDEGVQFEAQVEAGVDISAAYLTKRFDAICLTVGAGEPRDLQAEGRELNGIHQAIDYLSRKNRSIAGLINDAEVINAAVKKVVVIGGGDTGADCVGTALRQGAESVLQLEILPRPPEKDNPETPWPEHPRIYRKNPSHEEGGNIMWSVATKKFSGKDGCVNALECVEVEWKKDNSGQFSFAEKEGSTFTVEADMVILAMGFTGPGNTAFFDDLGLERDARGNIKTHADQSTSAQGIFAAGDAASGPSLIVRALASARRMAHFADKYLMGESDLPYPGGSSRV